MSPLNPAVALAEITFATFDGNVSNMHFAWIYLTFSWGGSLLAVLTYEFGFKKFQDSVAKHDELEEEQIEIEHSEPLQPVSEAT